LATISRTTAGKISGPYKVSVCYLLDFAKLKAIVTGFGVVPAEIPIFGTGISTIVLIQVILLNNFLSLVINFFFLTQMHAVWYKQIAVVLGLDLGFPARKTLIRLTNLMVSGLVN
jgi:hypothetical protein